MDGCTFFGLDRLTGETHSLASLRAKLEAVGMQRALTASLTSIQHHYQVGNQKTLAAVQDEGDFFTPLAVLTSETFVSGSGIIDEIRNDGFPAVAIFPGWPDTLSMDMGAGLSAPAYASIFDEAEQAGLPLLVGVHSRRDLWHLGRLAKSISTPVLFKWMSSAGYCLVPDIVSLARSCSNLFIDVSFAVQSGALEVLADRVDASRLFVASGAPLFYEACAPLLVIGSQLSDQIKQEILTGTLSEVLGTPVHHYDEPAEVKAFRTREKVDALWHSKTVAIVNPIVGPEDHIELGRRWGSSSLILSSFDAIFDEMDEGNAELAEWVERHDALWGLLAVHPRESEASARAIESYGGNSKFVGLKILQDTAYGISLDQSEFMQPIFDALRKHAPDWPVLAHPPGLAQAAEQNQDITFVCEHGIWRYAELLQLPNVYFDITTSTTDTRINDFSRFLRQVPASRLIYGSDAPMIDPAVMIGKLWSAGFDEDRHQAMLGDNARRVYSRFGAAFS